MKKTKTAARKTRPASDGTSTATKGKYLRKQVYLLPDEWDALRKRAFKDERSHSDIVRAALRRYLGLKD